MYYSIWSSDDAMTSMDGSNWGYDDDYSYVCSDSLSQ